MSKRRQVPKPSAELLDLANGGGQIHATLICEAIECERESIKFQAALAEDNDVAEMVHADLWREMMDLQSLVDAAYPDDHPLCREFAANLVREDVELPQYRNLLWLKHKFYRQLPEKERRRVLNGWMDWPAPRSTWIEMALAPDNEAVSRVLVLDGLGRDRLARWQKGTERDVRQVEAHQTAMLKRGGHPVMVTITEGVTRKEALEALAAIVDTIKSRWDVLISRQFPDDKQEA